MVKLMYQCVRLAELMLQELINIISRAVWWVFLKESIVQIGNLTKIGHFYEDLRHCPTHQGTEWNEKAEGANLLPSAPAHHWPPTLCAGASLLGYSDWNWVHAIAFGPIDICWKYTWAVLGPQPAGGRSWDFSISIIT